MQSTDWSEPHLAPTARDPELKHKLNLDFLTELDHDELKGRQVLRFAEEELDPIYGPVADY